MGARSKTVEDKKPPAVAVSPDIHKTYSPTTVESLPSPREPASVSKGGRASTERIWGPASEGTLTRASTAKMTHVAICAMICSFSGNDS